MCFIGGGDDDDEKRAEENQDVVEEITPGPPADSPTFLGARVDDDRIGALELTGDVSLPTISTGTEPPPVRTPPPGPILGGGIGGGFDPGPFDPGPNTGSGGGFGGRRFLPRIPGDGGLRRRRF